MKYKVVLGIGALVAGGLSANAGLVTFDDASLIHGSIVNTQYQSSLGLTIEAVNPNRNHDLAVAFDTNRTGTRDEDLENPFVGGNLPSNTDMGLALIIQENDRGIGDGIADRPDDEGGRPAGQLIFTFDSIVNNFGFHVIDLEDSTAERSSIVFSLGGSEVGDIDFMTFESGPNNAVFGDNSLNAISPMFITGGFDKVTINVGGSMAFDNIRWSVPDGGSTLALLGAGLLGLGALRRRR